jgi:hypothetical protein
MGMPGRIRHAACAWHQCGAQSLFEEMKNHQAQLIDMSRSTAVFTEDEG